MLHLKNGPKYAVNNLPLFIDLIVEGLACEKN
jgi:hypothetical protein